MKKIMGLWAFGLFSLMVSAQYEPGEINGLLESWQPPIEFPEVGIKTLTKLSDVIRIQNVDPQNQGEWTEFQKMLFPRNSEEDFTRFGIFIYDSMNTTWMPIVDYGMKYKYNTSKQVDEFSRELNSNGTIIKTNFKYSYNSDGNVSKSDQIDSIYSPQISKWVAIPAKDEYNYNGSKQLTEKIYSKASTGQTSLMLEKRWTFAYDGSGNCTEVIEFLYDESNSVWEKNERFIYSYDGSNRMNNYKYYFWNGTGWEQDNEEGVYTYDSNNRIKRTEDNEVVTNKGDEANDYFYHTDGRLDYSILQVRPNSSGTWVNSKKTVGFFDGNNKRLYSMVYDWDGAAWEKNPSQRILYSENDPATTPKAPSNLTVKNRKKKDDGKLYLSWDDNSDNEDGFIIHRSENGTDFMAIDSVNQDVAEYTDEKLKNSTTYYYKVSAYNSAGQSNFSNEADAGTLVGIENSRSDFHITMQTNQLIINGIANVTNVTIVNMAGKQIYQNMRPSQNLFIETGTWKKGVYLVNVEIAGVSQIKKILIP